MGWAWILVDYCLTLELGKDGLGWTGYHNTNMNVVLPDRCQVMLRWRRGFGWDIWMVS